MKIGFIINPHAGVARDLEGEVRKWANVHLQAEASFARTEKKGHATELASEMAARGVEVVVAVGGDGTVNETARGLLGSSAALGVVPCGSGNGLARGLGIPLSMRKAVAGLKNHRTSKIDVGMITNGSHRRFFFGFSGIGFDAYVGSQFNKRKGRRGLLPYVLLSLRGYWKFKPVPLRVTLDDRLVESRPFVLAVANTREYGNGAIIAPAARPDDGLLDVSILREFGFLHGLWNGWRLFNGTIDRIPEMSTYRVTRVRVECDRRFLFHADGEVEESDGQVEFEIHEEQLRVALPG